MIHCALILMALLPASWVVVGGVLMVITVVALILCALKWREAVALKKEVMELRDTMRMMRYEEANLSRMLHTVSKQPAAMPEEFAVQDWGIEKPAAEEMTESEDTVEESMSEVLEEEIPITAVAEGPEMEETVIEEIVTEGIVSEEVVSEEDVIEEIVAEDSIAEETLATAEEASVEETTVEEPFVETVPESPAATIEEEANVPSKPRKQAINERRPAIPTDLFAAWFEENAVEEKGDLTGEAAEDSAHVEVVEPVKGSTVEEDTNIEDSEPIIEVEAAQMDDATTDSAEKVAEPVELSKEDERFRRKLERIVNARMRNPNLNIDVIASLFGMGRTNFYRKVRELMGMSPNDYLRKCRMERASELLQTTELNVGEVCAQVGIPDAQYFSRVFKAYYGVSPSSYRER